MALLHPMTTIVTYLLYFFFSDPNSQLCTTSQRQNQICPDIYDPVCALLKGPTNDSRIANYNETTLPNGCYACRNPNVVGFVPGECGENNVTICSKNNSHLFCPAIFDPVCTFTFKQNRKPQIKAQTVSNACGGCGASDAKFWAKGNCTQLSSQICEKNQRNVKGCHPSFIQVCAYYRGNGCKEDLCRKTESSYCSACSDSHVLFYVLGKCEDS